MSQPEQEDWTENYLLGGRIILRQSRSGYRAGMDAALLAATCDARPGERVIEAGCGPGAALLSAAARREGAGFVGLERDREALALATANIDLNGFGDRVQVIAGDIARPFSYLKLKPFDAAIANPPYFDDPAALRGPAPARKAAWIADQGLAGWTTFLLQAVREGGTITIIHRSERLGDLIALLSEKAGSFRIRPIHPFADTPAKRVIVRAVKTGKAPLVLLPPLILHERGGAKHSAQAEAILRGDAALSWDESRIAPS
jgi:tRNA1(Val) A37 N6-methylase TrmN6